MESYTDLPIAEIKNKVGTILTAIVLGLIAIGLLSSIRSIDAGTVGVVKRLGRVTGRVLDPGAHLITPFFDSVVRYDTKKVTYETSPEHKQEASEADFKDYPVDTNTSDGQPVDLSYTVRFSVDPTKATWVAQNIGDEDALVEKIVKAESRVWARNIPRKYKAENIYTGQSSLEIQNEIFDAISGKFAENGLILDFFGIREIAFEQSYIDKIREKQEAEVQIQTEEHKASQETHRKQQRITAAEGFAKEQELQKQTLTSALLQKMWIEQWNGILPIYMMGDSQALIQLPR